MALSFDGASDQPIVLLFDATATFDVTVTCRVIAYPVTSCRVSSACPPGRSIGSSLELL